MQFASPTSLFWLLLAVPIVILYILKIRMRRVPVSTVMFWNQIFDERKPRSVWQRLRHLISLLFQLAFLALLAIAVADPFVSWDKLKARRLVLVVDNSASMAAQNGTITRLATAKQRSERLIRGLRIQDQLAIVSAGTVARVESGLTNHQRTLRDALQAIEATDGPTRVPQAIEIARRLLVEHDNAQVIVLSDGCFVGAANVAELTADMVHLDVIGKPVDNVAITQFQVRRSFTDIVGYQILVEVTNYSETAVECRLDVTLEDDLVDVIPLKLEPHQTHRQTLDHTSEAGGRVVAKIDVQDSLLVDNVAVAMLSQRDRQPVLLVTRGNLFLQSALSAIPLIQLRTVTELPDAIAADTIVILDGETPFEIPAGNVFVVHPHESTKLWRLGEAISEPIVTDQDSDSLLLTHVQLENIVLPEARALEIDCEHQVLAAAIDGEPMYVSIDHSQGKTLVITADLRKGDLPLRTAFPIMITNAINWFRGERAELQKAFAAGAIVECALGSTSADNPSSLVLRSPNGNDAPLPAGVERLTLGPLAQCGVWQVVRIDENADLTTTHSNETVIVEYACNLSSKQESNLRSTADVSVPPTAYGRALGGRPIWFYLIACGLLLTTLEWSLYQRRWIS